MPVVYVVHMYMIISFYLIINTWRKVATAYSYTIHVQ
jgi:hypothetical protein